MRGKMQVKGGVMNGGGKSKRNGKMASRLLVFLSSAAFFSLFLPCVVTATSYKAKDKVTLYVNKVGPYANPHETYHYYKLPVCHPEKIEHRSLTLGEVLDGDRMAVSIYNISFLEDVTEKQLCTVTMKQEDIENMKAFIEERYYFEFVLDETPIRDFVGHMEEELFAFPHRHRISLFTHMHFKIEYNDDKIIAASVSTKGHTALSLEEAVAPLDVTYTYSVKWQRTDAKYEDKGKRLGNETFFPRTLEIHWLSVINSMVLVFLLIGFIMVILMRVLGNDFARYNVRDESDDAEGNEYGWKIIHTDVFRFPARTMLLCAILGVGSQFLAIAFGIIGMALLGMFNVHRHGAVNAAACILYAVTCGIAGFVSAKMYRQLGGKAWVRGVNLTSSLFSVPLFVVWSFQNTVAWAYNSTQALPFTTVLLLGVVWFTVGYPLTVVGGILGKNSSGNFVPPCRPKLAAREIPRVPWYKSTLAHCAVGGFLPFSAISVELYYIFATLWGRERYTLYGILLVVFIILMSVTACVSVALTYFQLAAEDHRWWWRAVTSAGSTALFVLAYAVFYYTRRSNMSGLLQCVEFFSWTLLMCYVFFLALSTVAFFASFTFVCRIYSILKMD